MADYRTPSPLAREAMAYVLAGGRGTRLYDLTDRRAKPAVYFGGKSRIIDFALSNALNSGIRRISLGPRLTQTAFWAVERAAREILDKGTFGFARDIVPFGELQGLFTAKG